MSQSPSNQTSESTLVAENCHVFQHRLSARQAKRAAKAAERKEKSDALKEEGDVFFRDGDFQAALDMYQQAINVHGPSAKPVLLTNLAAAYLKLAMYPAAHEAAGKALTADPKSTEARYRRGVARQHMGMWLAAQTDFSTVLTLDPGCEDAEARLGFVRGQRDDQDDAQDAHDYGAPASADDPELGESLSESSDCEHAGNGIPCKFYNRTECKNGRACLFSHAPDDKSVRDALGRNVCRYYLLGACRFGERCTYSHSKAYLLQRGWWSTPEGIDEQRRVYNALQANKKAAASQNKRAKPQRGRKKRGHASRSGPVAGLSSRRIPFHSHSELDEYESDGFEDDMAMCGFTGDQVAELISYGVKPWEDDAWDVLRAVHEDY